jgi:predicted phosphoribosyltransferase
MRYSDRRDAGRQLAAAVAKVLAADAEDVLVVGIPRGGVLVAAPVAAALGAPLDVAVARKIGAPLQPELAIGAVSADGPPYLNTQLIERMGVPDQVVEDEIAEQRREAHRRETLYRRDRPPLEVSGRTVVVVDDGIATGATMVAVLRMLRAAGATRTVMAVPVGPAETLQALRSEADEVICPMVPQWFMAVGEWYDDFRQTTDREVLEALGAG